VTAQTIPTPRAALLATASVVFAAFCWGLNAVFAKEAFAAGIAPDRLAQARVVVAGVPLLLALGLFRRDLLRPPRATWLPIAVFGIGVVAVNWAYYTAIDRLSVGVAISLQYTAPVMVLVLTTLWARRNPGTLTWVAGGLTLAGAVLVSGAYDGLRDLDGVGVAAGIASALSFGVYLISAEVAGRRGAHAATVLTLGLLVAAVAWGAILPWWGWPVERLTDGGVILRVLAVGVVGTLIPFLLAVNAVRIISAAVAGIAATTEPLFAASLAWLLLNQELGALQLLGGGLVVAGVVIAQFARGPAQSDAGESPAVEVTP
jgi:drug/metabolite transporter (DMT)-like permease